MATPSLSHIDHLNVVDRVLSMSADQLQSDVPTTMRLQGFSDDEINRTLEIVLQLQDQFKMPVIE